MWRCSLALACGIGLLLGTSWSADPPAKSAEPAKTPAKGTGKAVDLLKLFPGAIFIVGEDSKDALQQPGMVLVSPEKLKELQDQIEQLKKQVGAEKPESPSRCLLSGRVEGEIVRLKAHFEFKTHRPREPIALGCQKTWPTSVTLDNNRLPVLLPPSDEGFVVLVETPGDHQLTLELELPVAAKGTDRGFDLGLPRAAVTLLESFDLPAAVREARVGNRQFASKDLQSRGREPIPLGAISKLEVAWKGPAPQQPGEALLAAQGEIAVRVDETHVTTEVDLTLKVLRGQTDIWRLHAPVQAHVESRGPVFDERAPAIAAPLDEKNPVWTIRLKEPSADPVRLGIRYRQPRMGKQVPIGPFQVLNPNTFRQQGTISVAAPPDVRLRYVLRGDISQREVPEELSDAVASFTYYSLPAPGPKAQILPPMEIEIEAIKGAVETPSVVHNLALDLKRNGWRVHSKFDFHPIRTTVERLEIEMPAAYEEVRISPAILVEEVEYKDKAPDRKVAQVRLASKQLAQRVFSVELEAFQPTAPEAQQAAVGLPAPVGTFEGGGEITAAVPVGWELSSPDLGWHLPQQGPRPQSFRATRLPPQVSLAWRKHRPDLPVDSVIDVTIGDRLAQVKQRLQYSPVNGELGRSIALKGPASLAGRLPVVEQGYPIGAHADRSGWSVSLPDALLKDRKPLTLTLDYSFELPETEPDWKKRRFLVPLIWPENATRGVTKVRIWTEAGTQPAAVGGAWEEQPTEAVADKDSLPTLVLRGSGLEIPLSLELHDADLAPLATVAVDRALLQAMIEESGLQSYRARFLITKLNAHHLDVELPGPPPSINLEVFLDGKDVKSRQTLEESKEGEIGKTVRLKLDPDLYRRPRVLEIRYQLTPGQGFDSDGGGGNLWTALRPPRLHGHVFLGRVRWQVAVPSSWVVLHTGDEAATEQRWGWRGWLAAPRPAVAAADLEHWFSGPDDAAGSDTHGVMPVTSSPSLVCWQTSLKPLRLLHLSQQIWLLSCSLVVLVLGLVLYNAPLSRGQFWGLVAALGLAGVLVGVLWPDMLPAVIYGAEPGLAILLLVLGIQWLLQRHYRRQVVFMPGFQRIKPGSSLVRSTGSSRPRREPSTVDAPPGSEFGAAGS